jgi:hypothetical protein
MSWSVSELDKNKTEQAISNEEARLDICRVERERLFNELCRIQRENKIKEEKMIQQINKIDVSIESGEQFLNECKEHLNDFD